MPRRRRRHLFPIFAALRASLALLLVVAIVGALAFAVALLFVHPNAYKPEIEALARRATGRVLAVRGPIHLRFTPWPHLSAEDIELANQAGASGPRMLTLARVEARVALLPLASRHIVVTDLTLVQPDIALERDAAGRGNWVMAPRAAPAAASPGDAAPGMEAAPSARWRFAIRAIHVEQGRLDWRARPGAEPAQILMPRIDLDAAGADGAITISGDVSVGDRLLRLSGETGALDTLFDQAAEAPWPLRVVLEDPTARLSAAGVLAEPTRGRGLSLQLDAAVTDFTGLTPFLPAGLTARQATIAAHWDDGLTAITAKLGAARLPRLLPDALIDHADITAPSPDQPVHAQADGSSPTLGKLRLVLTAGRLGALAAGARPAAPLPLELELAAGPASLTAKGTVGSLVALRGLDLDVAAQVPDLAPFAPVVGRRLPPWRDLAFQAHLSGDLHGPEALGLRGATLSLPEGQLAGDAELRLGAPPAIKAEIAAKRIDLDSLRADLAMLAQPLQPAPPDSALPAPAPAPDAVPPAPAAPAAPGHWLVPDTPLDLSALDRLDADLSFRIEQLQAGGVGYTQVLGHAILDNGRLVVEKLAAITPAGPAEARLSVDSHAADIPVALFLHAPSLQLSQLAPLLDESVAATGSVAINADLRGAGRTPHAIAASLEGRLAIGSADATLDNALLLDLTRLVKLPPVPLNAAGTTRLRCVAVALAFAKGVAAVDPLVLDLGRLAVVGGGSIDFGQETLALQLRSMLRFGGGAGAGIVVPVRLAGPWRAPKASMDGGKGPPATGAGLAEPCGAALAAITAPPVLAKAVPAGAQGAPAAAAAQAKPDAARRAAATLLDTLKSLQVTPR